MIINIKTQERFNLSQWNKRTLISGIGVLYLFLSSLIINPSFSKSIYSTIFYPKGRELKQKLDTISKSHWETIKIFTKESFRSVFVLNEKIIWASGTHGTVICSLDGGKSWKVIPIKGAENLDFRGISVLNKENIIVISSGESEMGLTRIYRSNDGGMHWDLVYQAHEPGVFLDGIQFYNHKHGLVLGDPVQNKFLILETLDGGLTWERKNISTMPNSNPEEGAFAASNSSIFLNKKGRSWFGTGGDMGGRVFYSVNYGNNWEVSSTSILKGKSSGIFSLFFENNLHGYGVGGNFQSLVDSSHNIIETLDGGHTWFEPSHMIPSGFVESLIQVGRKSLLGIGPAGTSLSSDGGKNWLKIDNLSFHALSKKEETIWAVGPNGLIGKWIE